MHFFYYFFWECSSPNQVEIVPKTKPFFFFFFSLSLFFSLSWPGLARNEARTMFLFFSNFYYFFWVFLGCSSPSKAEMVPVTKIFLFYLTNFQLSLARNESKMTFLPFWIFLQFFWECSSSGPAETVPRKKKICPFFRPVTACFG